jgi:hypothetical protein
MNAENAKSVSPMAAGCASQQQITTRFAGGSSPASLFAEASGETGVTKGQSGRINPLVEVVGGNGLLAGGNQIPARCEGKKDAVNGALMDEKRGGTLLSTFTADFVQLLVELTELGARSHGFFFHEKRCLKGRVSARAQSGQGC